MCKTISTAASTVILSAIVFHVGYYAGSKFTTKLYKKCVEWAQSGDDFEHIYGTGILWNELGIRYVKRPTEK